MCLKNILNSFIFSSSASVYGYPKKKKISEKHELNPKNPYAESKLKIEQFLLNNSKKTPINYIILRYFNVGGASSSGKIGEIGNKNDRLIKNLAIQYFKAKPKINKFLINGRIISFIPDRINMFSIPK